MKSDPADLERLAAAGVLAIGLVHDLNTALGAIAGLAELAAETPQTAAADLRSIAREATRAADLTRRLLAVSSPYARTGDAPVAVDEVLDDIEPLVSRLFAYRIVVERRGGLGKPVVANAASLRQAIINLCLHGADAIDGRGRITLGAGERDLEAGDAARLGLSPGPYAAVTVADSGARDERRSGLGLAMVQRTVREANGAVEAEAPADGGHRFTIYLPLVRPCPVKGSDPIPGQRRARGTGPILRQSDVALVVDDELRAREVAARVLRGLGIAVIEAADSLEARDVLAARGDDVALVVAALAEPAWLHALRAASSVPLLVLPARADDPAVAELLALPNVSSLAKPYRIDELRAHVAGLLDVP